MNNQDRFDLNLASHPITNRRLFFLLVLFLGLLFFIAMIAGGKIFIDYGLKSNDIKTASSKVDQEGKNIEREEKQLSTQMDTLIKNNKKKVDLINSLIYRKSFSWVDFLSSLENTLPNECYIVSLSPTFRGEEKVDFRLMLASPDLNTLLEFIQNLNKQGFQQIRVSSESRAETGFFLYEMSLSYERNL